MPEVPVTEDELLARVEDAYANYGFCVAVISENIRDPDGLPLGGHDAPWFIDDFGHPYYDSPARYLAGRISRSLGVRARYEKPGTIQRSFIQAASESDLAEAEMAGRAAVSAIREGRRGAMITLERDDTRDYNCYTGIAALEEVGGRVRPVPDSFLSKGEAFVTQDFIDYLKPLVGPLPVIGRLI